MNNARDLALAMGIGSIQADMLIPYLWMSPSTTDPDMPAVRVMVEAIQNQLMAMGTPPLRARGELDVPTATWLRMVTGVAWTQMTWAQIFEAILVAKQSGRRLATPMKRSPAPVGFLPDLPDPPTLLLLGAAGALFWFTRKKR